LIEGAVPSGACVALLEDVLTTGGSSRVAIEALRADGYVVDHVFALVDRAEGAIEGLAALGVEAHALFHRSDFVR
jgi:orotate phosphoribosyltransferase